ncbi:hypothetical protein [Bacillus sp. REN10]|uniref:hypothetical protein n=1 Tax=Bacillus sp. REN10 TaxID=2782541 RepID=UPI00193AF04E|nr:hypothetical protein [Bacillus sp. REN10]
MLTCNKHHEHALSHSIAAADESLATFASALVLLAEAEQSAKIENDVIKDLTTSICTEIAQLQKLSFKKHKHMRAYIEQSDKTCFIPSSEQCYTLNETISKLYPIVNSLSLTLEERMELYELVQENQQWYKKRRELFSYSHRFDNDPATTWLSIYCPFVEKEKPAL